MNRPSAGQAAGEEHGLAMRTENVLRWIAIGCAVFLLLGPFGGRTAWGRGSPTTMDSAGYNFAALGSGVVALAALGVAFWARPRVVVPLLGAAVAMAAFGLTAYVSGTYWLALSRGEALLEGRFAMPEKMTVFPAWGPPFFATAALFGAISALALAVLWLRLMFARGRST
jgi:hypothetical protein